MINISFLPPFFKMTLHTVASENRQKSRVVESYHKHAMPVDGSGGRRRKSFKLAYMGKSLFVCKRKAGAKAQVFHLKKKNTRACVNWGAKSTN